MSEESPDESAVVRSRGPIARGPIAWFAKNSVAANLLMFMLLIGGLLMTCQIKQEVFPESQLDVVRISVPYPGASPAEIEQGILRAVEEAVRGLDGVDRVTSVANEDAGSVIVELELDADKTNVLSEVKNEVDRLTTLPQDAERPIVSLVTNRFEVIALILYGDVDRAVLRRLAEQAREEMLADPAIANVELVGAPSPEIAIEVSEDTLRANDLSLDQIANAVKATALELPGGSVKTESGEVLLRTTERRWTARDFHDVPVLTSATGTEVPLEQLADIRQTFAETDEASWYDGKPAMMIKVFRTGEQTPIAVAERAKKHVERLQRELPAGVSVATWVDWSEIYQQRVDLLLRNAGWGLLLVLGVLGLFLELRLAFWVTMGIPVSFLGAVLLMPALDVSVNMISLFAFIVTLGMVVDDAIVVGENIFELRNQGKPPLTAAIEGAKGVAIPVCFSIATTVVAFAPMLFVPGFSGKLYRVIPSIVIAVLVISLVESLWVLPAHLASLKPAPTRGVYAALHRQQQRVARGLERFIAELYSPFLRVTLRQRYVAFASGVALLIASFGFVAGGHVPFRFMPSIDGDLAIASVELPYGTPVEETQRIQEQMLETAREILKENGEEGIVRGIFSQVGTPLPGDPGQVAAAVAGSHLANVQVWLVSPDERKITSSQFIEQWRERVGRVANAERLSFEASIGPSPGAPINVELIHDDMAVLEQASAELAEELRKLQGVWDIDDGYSVGKPQLDLQLTPEAVAVGLSSADVARQVRNSFYGAEALRQQERDGRNEVRVMVRLPRDERKSIHDVESLVLETPQGGEIGLTEAARIQPGRAYPVIRRSSGRRMVAVSADVRQGISPNTVLEAVETKILPELMERHPGLDYAFGGAQREQGKSMGSLATGGLMALIIIFALLAIPFKSYLQPIIVMTAIPFGFVGALGGHVLTGYELSMISVMGLVALSGVVVNDSLVLIAASNDYRNEGLDPAQAIHAAGVRRFRPILLTSLTTFLGLIPMITETSVQAKFLIPMAVSLGFGVLFATVIILLLVPALYLILEDVKRLLGGPSHPGGGAELVERAPAIPPGALEDEAPRVHQPSAPRIADPEPGE